MDCDWRQIWIAVNAALPPVLRNDWVRSGRELSDKTVTLHEYQGDMEHVYTLNIKPNGISAQRDR